MSNDSPITKSHPESFYNLENRPHLKPAFLVDRALYYLTIGLLKANGSKSKILSVNEIKKINSILKNGVLSRVRIIEFYVVDIEKTIKKFAKYIESKKYTLIKHSNCEITIIQDKKYRRLGSKIDLDCVFNRYLSNSTKINSQSFDSACVKLREQIKDLNQQKYIYVQGILDDIVNSSNGHIFYHFLDPNGPKQNFISAENPLVSRYFSICCQDYNESSIENDEILMNSADCKYILANQGWVVGSPTFDFVSPGSEVYVRRQLIAWADCAKIRWGNCMSDAPFIWEYMEKYVISMANCFDGFRIDNCHSTPIHVLEFLIDSSRRIKPNLILIGELFTDSELEDNLFVNRIGLTCLIRERMSASSLTELCHMVHRFGGIPIGSFFESKSSCVKVKPAVTRAILTDMTHDNECLFIKYSPFEYVPSCAFVAMASCPIGSVRGFDEIVPYQVDTNFNLILQINVVSESKLYSTWLESEIIIDSPLLFSQFIRSANSNGKIGSGLGIVHLRKFMNQFHTKMQLEGFNQIYVDQVSPSIVTVTRNNPSSGVRYVLISNHALEKLSNEKLTIAKKEHFMFPPPISTEWQYPEISIPGIIEEVLIEAYMVYCEDNQDVQQDTNYICASNQFCVYSQTNFKAENSKVLFLIYFLMTHVRVSNSADFSSVTSHVSLPYFPPGSVIIFKVSLHGNSIKKIHEVENKLSNINNSINLIINRKTSILISYSSNAKKKKMMIFVVQNILFPILVHSYTKVYLVKHLLIIQYIGIQNILSKIKSTNDLGHPLCKNLRDGYWLLDFIVTRLGDYQPTKQKLILSSFALVGSLRNIKPPRVHQKIIQKLSIHINPEVTVSAGLPFFSSSWSRMWGRDIFISLKGLLVIPGRIEEAKITILALASSIRHGLIPNLISSLGATPRYNSRDSPWFFIQAIKDYIEITKDVAILSEKVYRIFPKDNSEAKLTDSKPIFNLSLIIQEIIQKHYDGIDFVERNHDPLIDSCMKEDGFHVVCGIDHNTGYVFGGNRWNCGTWMDKMGSSDIASNKGFPATPRDGSPIELVALFSSTLTWLSEISNDSIYPFKGVTSRNDNMLVTWDTLNDKIKNNFEESFWIPKCRLKAIQKFHAQSPLINKTGIYKDTFGSSLDYCDYQFRPNILIAMCVAPDLFKPKKAVHVLRKIHKELEGKYGMSTLDHSDWNYCGFYVNSNSSSDFKVANGFNYHQGPEWLWLTGYYIRALILFSKFNDDKEEFDQIIRSMLCRLYEFEENNEWLGLPELTQENGEYCADSTRIQSWSVACIIDALRDFYANN
ncbi:hypothetical protein MXB_3007 [Myxobolus squamalis]|nr:hypothetical protein MXB_3007 [Myxobolus squamalis]